MKQPIYTRTDREFMILYERGVLIKKPPVYDRYQLALACRNLKREIGKSIEKLFRNK